MVPPAPIPLQMEYLLWTIWLGEADKTSTCYVIIHEKPSISNLGTTRHELLGAKGWQSLQNAREVILTKCLPGSVGFLSQSQKKTCRLHCRILVFKGLCTKSTETFNSCLCLYNTWIWNNAESQHFKGTPFSMKISLKKKAKWHLTNIYHSLSLNITIIKSKESYFWNTRVAQYLGNI